MGKFFKPLPLLPPQISTRPNDYEAYLKSYKLYLNELNSLKSSWKHDVKDEKVRMKTAAKHGNVLVKVWSASPSSSGDAKPALKEKKSPAPPPKKATKPEEAKAAIKRKRQRYRRNRRLRRLDGAIKLAAKERKLAELKGSSPSYAVVAASSVPVEVAPTSVVPLRRSTAVKHKKGKKPEEPKREKSPPTVAVPVERRPPGKPDNCMTCGKPVDATDLQDEVCVAQLPGDTPDVYPLCHRCRMDQQDFENHTWQGF